MLRTFLKAKIHGARVTRSDVNYMGSITVDSDLMKKAGILPLEMVHVFNLNNGNRLTTYAIEGEAGSGEIGLNGAAAHKCAPGDRVLILSFVQLEDREVTRFKSTVLLLDSKNRVEETLIQRPAFRPGVKKR